MERVKLTVMSLHLNEEIMRIITLLLLFVATDSFSSQTYTDVYKCQSSSKQITYQKESCLPSTANQKIIEIKKLDARQLEEAENKLKTMEAERQRLDKAEQVAAEQQSRARVESERRNPVMPRLVSRNYYPRRVYYPSPRYVQRNNSIVYPRFSPIQSALPSPYMRIPTFSSPRKFR